MLGMHLYRNYAILILCSSDSIFLLEYNYFASFFFLFSPSLTLIKHMLELFIFHDSSFSYFQLYNSVLHSREFLPFCHQVINFHFQCFLFTSSIVSTSVNIFLISVISTSSFLISIHAYLITARLYLIVVLLYLSGTLKIIPILKIDFRLLCFL